MRYRNTVTFIIFLSIAAGCSSDSDNPISERSEESIFFDSIDRGFNTQLIESPRRLTATNNQADLDQLWPSISSRPTPTIGQRTATVIVAEMGTRGGTGVAEIFVDEVVDKAEYLEVHVTSRIPGPGCTTDAALSTPFHAISVDSVMPVIFRERLEIVQCN